MIALIKFLLGRVQMTKGQGQMKVWARMVTREEILQVQRHRQGAGPPTSFASNSIYTPSR